MSSDTTLYERLGERDAIAAVVDRFYDRVLDDEELSGFFEDVDVKALRTHQTQFLSAATGGPVAYGGAGVQEAHEGLEITDEAFDAVADHLGASLRAFDVEPADREAVLETVEDLREEVVAV